MVGEFYVFFNEEDHLLSCVVFCHVLCVLRARPIRLRCNSVKLYGISIQSSII
jgi:hypothetical protein